MKWVLSYFLHDDCDGIWKYFFGLFLTRFGQIVLQIPHLQGSLCTGYKSGILLEVFLWMAWKQTRSLDVLMGLFLIDRFRSRGQQLCRFLGTKEGFYIRKISNPHRIFLVHQHGRCLIALVHQYGRREVMWKRSIGRACCGYCQVK